MRRVGLFLTIGILCCLMQTYGEENQSGFPGQRNDVVHLGSFSLVINDSVEPPVMYPEPSFTQGNSNTVLWSSDYDTFYVQYDTTYNFYNPTTSPPVSDTFWTPGNELVNGQTYWYQVLAKSGSEASRWSDSTSSTQDTVPPAITDVRIPEANSLGWCKEDTFHVTFAASDTSGIDSVYLYSRRCDEKWPGVPDTCEGYWPCTTGNPGPTTVIDTFTFIAPHDGCYDFFVGAKDAAHAPESHEDYWICDGNEMIPEDTVVHGKVKIDTHLPTSEVICDILEDTTYAYSFPVWFTANDTVWPAFLSGLDTIWLFAAYDTNKFTQECTTSNFPDSSAVETFCTFKADSGDGWYFFYTIAKDRAGNKQATPACTCSTYVTTAVEIGLTLYHGDDPNDTRYTNEDTVGVRVKLLRGDIIHTYDICFFAGDSCVGDTLCQWDSVYFNYDRTKDSVIALPNSEEQGLKVVFCQINNLQTHSTSNCTSANIIYDSLPCTMDSLQIFDLLTFEEDTIDGAWYGYTDSVLVRAFIFGLNCGDNLGECAPPESIRFIGDIPGSTVVVPFRDTVDTVLLSEGNGTKTIFCEVLDSAGNWSQKNSGSITLDTHIDPICIDVDSFVYIDSVEIRFVDEGRNTDLFRSRKIDIYLGDTCRESVQSYSKSDTFKICDSTGLHYIYVQARDSAGNWTPEVYDSTFYVQRCTLFSITLIDTFPLQEPGMAKTGWTNDTLVWLLPKYDECPLADSIAVADCDCMDSTCNDTVKHGLRDTILIHLKPTYQRHCIKAWLTYADTVSNSVSDTIVYDSVPPELRLMDVKENQLTEGREWILDDPNIEVDIETFDNECLYSYDFIENAISRWTEANTFRECPSSFKGNLLHTLRPEEGKIDLLLTIYDAGGNSATLGDTIYYDKPEPIVAFPNPFNPAQGEHATIRLKEPAKGVRIYDPFGNLVRELKKVQNSHDFIWDGRNGRGKIVANGGYLVVAKGIKRPYKIAVLKK